MKKVFKWIGIVLGGIVLLIVIASVALMFIVTKDMIAEQAQKALNRQVTIGDISVSVFSVVSGIEVKDVKVSNFKTPAQMAALKGKPVAAGDVFVGLKAFNFKLKFLPLLSGRVELRELVLIEPAINVTRYKSGLFNFSDLTAPKKMTAEEKAEALKKAEEEAKKKAEEAKKPQEPAKPFTADDLPLEILIGKVGIEKGVLTFVDQGIGQTIQAYNLTVLVHSIEIDPKDLANKDTVGLKVNMGLKTIGQVPTGSVKSFDVGVSITGNVKPFDVKTKLPDPEVAVKVGSSYGTLTGMQIFQQLKSVEALEKYCGKLAFLKDDVKWKNAFVNVWYKAGIVKLTDGKIQTDDYALTFAGMTNINTKAVNLDMDMTLAKGHTGAIRSGIEKNVSKGIKAAKLDKYVKADKVTETAMKPLLNKDGNAYFKYKVTGTMAKPDAKLVAPKLPSLGDMIRDSAGDLKDMAVDKGKKEAKKAAEKGAEKATKKATKKLKKLF